MSDYRISITRKDSHPIHLRPGGKGERLLVESVVRAALSKGIGVFRTETHVAQAIRTAFDDVLYALKLEAPRSHLPDSTD